MEERVAERLADLPPVVKVAASEVQATVAPEAPILGQKLSNEKWLSDMMDGIETAVKETMGGRQYQA